MKNFKEFIIIMFCFCLSLILGLISHDVLIGSFTLLTGLLTGYYATKGTKTTYIYGAINYLLLSYIALKNNLYGIFLFYLFLFTPLQIEGFFHWKKNMNKENKIEIRTFTLKNSFLIIMLCIISSLIVGYLLNLFPKQQLAFIDATSNCINLCGMILMILRFKESWWLWLVNNIIDLYISIYCVTHHGENSVMMLFTAISFLLINILGIIKWNKKAKKS